MPIHSKKSRSKKIRRSRGLAGDAAMHKRNAEKFFEFHKNFKKGFMDSMRAMDCNAAFDNLSRLLSAEIVTKQHTEMAEGLTVDKRGVRTTYISDPSDAYIDQFKSACLVRRR